MSRAKLVFFGGLNGVGANCIGIFNEQEKTGVLVDAGKRFFRDDSGTLVDESALLPDMALLEKYASEYDIQKILLSHSHIDHAGGAAVIANQHKIPVITTETGEFFLRKQASRGAWNQYKEELATEVVSNARFARGYESKRERMDKLTGRKTPFNLRYGHKLLDQSIISIPRGEVVPLQQISNGMKAWAIQLNHSTPETLGYLIECNNVWFLVLADHKLNGFYGDTPRKLFEKAIMEVVWMVAAANGKLVLISDSLYSARPGIVPPEDIVLQNLKAKLIEKLNDSRYPNRNFYITCVSSNVSRIGGICRISKEVTGQWPMPIGVSIQDVFDKMEVNYYYNHENTNVFVFTGHQGEGKGDMKSGIWRLMEEDGWNGLRIKEDDVVAFSSSLIPGNEEALLGGIYRLDSMGVNVLLNEGQKDAIGVPSTCENVSDDTIIHFPGHGKRKDRKWVLEATRPTVAIPFHSSGNDLLAYEEIAPAGTECVFLNDGEEFSI